MLKIKKQNILINNAGAGFWYPVPVLLIPQGLGGVATKYTIRFLLRQADNERFCYFLITFVTQNSIQNDQFLANEIRFLLADS